MVWVFKTSVENKEKVEEVLPLLDSHVLPHGRWNFDLEDCDKILRIEHDDLQIDALLTSLNMAGVVCEELVD